MPQVSFFSIKNLLKYDLIGWRYKFPHYVLVVPGTKQNKTKQKRTKQDQIQFKCLNIA